eukprot:COSAG06_NODE_24390_length_664_cov_1.092035_1_plen_184_part_00
MEDILHGQFRSVWVVLHVHYRGSLIDKRWVPHKLWNGKGLPEHDDWEWRKSATANIRGTTEDIFDSIQSVNLRFGVDLVSEASANTRKRKEQGDFNTICNSVDADTGLRTIELQLDRTDIPKRMMPAVKQRAVQQLLEYTTSIDGQRVIEMQESADTRAAGSTWNVCLVCPLAMDRDPGAPAP